MFSIAAYDGEKLIKEIEYENFDKFYNPSDNLYPQSKFKNIESLNNLNFGITIINPTENGDFIINNCTDELLNYYNLTNKDVKWRKIDEIFPYYYLTFEDILISLNKNEIESKKLKCEIKDNGKLKILIEYIFLKLNHKYIVIINNSFKDFSQIKRRDQQIFENSQQGIAIYQDKELVLMNNSYLNGEGLNLKHSEFDEKNFKLRIHKDEKIENITKKIFNKEIHSFEDEFSYINPKGEIEYYHMFLMPYTYHNKPAIKINILNITHQAKSQIKSQEYQENLRILQRLIGFEVFTWTSTDGYKYSPEIYNILEITDPNKKGENFKGTEYIQYNSLNPYYEWLEEVKSHPKKGMHFNLQYIAKTFTGKTKYLSGFYLTRMNKYSGRYDAIIGFIQDITDYYKAQRQLKKTLREKEILLKELHERASINLEVLLSLIRLDARPRKEGEKKTTIQATSNRVQSLVFVQKEFAKSQDFSTINISKVLEKIVNHLLKTYKLNHVSLHNEMEDFQLEMERSIPISLIITELALNCIDSAFPNNKEGNLYLKLVKDKKNVRISVMDDGMGIPDDFDIHNVPTPGFIIMNSLILQIHGEIRQIPKHRGAEIQIEFPIEKPSTFT